MKLKRRTLRVYAYYRRHSLIPRWCMAAFDLHALQAFHVYESTGVLPKQCKTFTDFSKSNGYANGKWVAKLTHDMIKEDLQEGLITKWELVSYGACRWWYSRLWGTPKKMLEAFGWDNTNFNHRR